MRLDETSSTGPETGLLAVSRTYCQSEETAPLTMVLGKKSELLVGEPKNHDERVTYSGQSPERP
jgi:hypothetical protein